MHACERRTPIKDTRLWEMYFCERCTPVGDARLRLHLCTPVSSFTPAYAYYLGLRLAP
jgi:hypothetical protein